MQSSRELLRNALSLAVMSRVLLHLARAKKEEKAPFVLSGRTVTGSRSAPISDLFPATSYSDSTVTYRLAGSRGRVVHAPSDRSALFRCTKAFCDGSPGLGRRSDELV